MYNPWATFHGAIPGMRLYVYTLLPEGRGTAKKLVENLNPPKIGCNDAHTVANTFNHGAPE